MGNRLLPVALLSNQLPAAAIVPIFLQSLVFGIKAGSRYSYLFSVSSNSEYSLINRIRIKVYKFDSAEEGSEDFINGISLGKNSLWKPLYLRKYITNYKNKLEDCGELIKDGGTTLLK